MPSAWTLCITVAAAAACAPGAADLERRRLAQQVDTLQNQLNRLDTRVDALSQSVTVLGAAHRTSGTHASTLPPPPAGLRVERLTRADTWPDGGRSENDEERGSDADSSQAPSRPPRLLTLPRERASAASAPVAAQLFEKALQDYQRGATAQASSGFESWLRRYPEHAEVASARYWLGQCKYEQGAYEAAIEQFRRLHESTPRAAKAPEALLKIGLAYERQHQPDKATTTFAQLIASYPQSAAAELARGRLRPPPERSHGR